MTGTGAGNDGRGRERRWMGCGKDDGQVSATAPIGAQAAAPLSQKGGWRDYPTPRNAQPRKNTPPPKHETEKPSPSGRGLGEGETPNTANPGQWSHPRRPTVIPAQAGIQNPGSTWRKDGRTSAGVVRCRGRGNPPNPLLRKGGFSWAPPYRHSRPISSFPRKRESTRRDSTGVLDSGLRQNDGGDGGRVVSGRVWIPAFAGMTVGGRE